MAEEDWRGGRGFMEKLFGKRAAKSSVERAKYVARKAEMEREAAVKLKEIQLEAHAEALRREMLKNASESFGVLRQSEARLKEENDRKEMDNERSKNQTDEEIKMDELHKSLQIDLRKAHEDFNVMRECSQPEEASQEELINKRTECESMLSQLRNEVALLKEHDTLMKANPKFKSKFFNDFKATRLIGCGRFGIVFEVDSLLDLDKYAVKRISIDSSKSSKEKTLHDAQVTSRLYHPGIIRYYSLWIETPPKEWLKWANETLLKDIDFADMLKTSAEHGGNAFLYIAMELCEFSLEDWLSRNQDQSTRSFTRMKNWLVQIASALAYLHQQQLVHGNLKPRNILLAEKDMLKITFDPSISDIKSQPNDMYISPEQQLNILELDSKTDVFTLGLIFAELCVVMTSDEVQKIFDNIRRGISTSKLDQHPEAKRIVECLTKVSKDHRPNCEAILTHSFIDESTITTSEKMKTTSSLPMDPEQSEAVTFKAGNMKSQEPVAAIGIDLGTTYTAVSYVDKGGIVRMIQNSQGHEITPSVVHFHESYQLVGEEAVKMRTDASKSTIYYIRRIIGRQHNDAFLQKRQWPFEIIRGSNGRACVRIDNTTHTPEYISSVILREMRTIAQKVLFSMPTNAVITVPANFTNSQREATIEAGRLAGLNVLQLVNEPSAAAIAISALSNADNRHRKVLVFDLGGGTSDVSIVNINGNSLTVIATDGLTLGGVDFDERIYEEAVHRYQEMGILIGKNDIDWTLMEACETAKRALSKMNSTRIVHRRHAGKGFDLTYDKFLELTQDLFERTIMLIDKVLGEARYLDEGNIDEILLVGGSTRMRRVRELLEKRFPVTRIRTDIEPELAVAKGAAILADSLSRRLESTETDASSSSTEPFIFLNDVAPFQLGLRLDGTKCKTLIPRNTRIPFTTYEMITNAGENDTVQTIEILEENADCALKNATLAIFDIAISPKPAGENLTKVIHSIDINGILSVSAIDRTTNEELSVTIRSVKQHLTAFEENGELANIVHKLI